MCLRTCFCLNNLSAHRGKNDHLPVWKKPGLPAWGNALTISTVSEMRRKKSKRGFLWSAQRNASKTGKLFNLKRNASKNNFETFCVFVREMRQKKLNRFWWAIFGGVKNGRNLLTKNRKLTYMQKNFLGGLIFSTSWGSGHKNSKTPSRLDFF